MMRNLSKLSVISTILGSVCLIATSTVGCNGGETPEAQHASAAPAVQQPAADQKAADGQAAADETTAAKPDASELEKSSLADAEAPFVLKLDSNPKDLPDNGVVELTARIDAHHALATPTSISIELPAGAKLVSGEAKETLADLPAGTTTRVFKVALSQKLSDPIKVSVGMVDPNGRFGAHATRLFPEPAQPASVKTSRVPSPPVGRPGAGIKATRGGPGDGPTQPGTR